MVALILALFLALSKSLHGERLQLPYLSFFWLGAGFMLIETKAITELSLNFGNTWFVIGIVIAAILLMCFAANWAVQVLKLKNQLWSYILLLVSLGVGFYASINGGFPSSLSGKIADIVVLTCPLLFSGVVFSILLCRCRNISAAMSMNLLEPCAAGCLNTTPFIWATAPSI